MSFLLSELEIFELVNIEEDELEVCLIYRDFSVSQSSVESLIHGLAGSGGVMNGSNSIYCSK